MDASEREVAVRPWIGGAAEPCNAGVVESWIKWCRCVSYTANRGDVVKQKGGAFLGKMGPILIMRRSSRCLPPDRAARAKRWASYP